MILPSLDKDPRDREFKQYPRDLREEVVMEYLFESKSHRNLDRDVLCLDSNQTKGWQSMGILHHYGLKDNFKGIFSGMSAKDVLAILNDKPEFDEICDIISETPVEEGTIQFDNPEGYNRRTWTNLRVHQDAFRNKILDAYDSTCCITGIREAKILRASHIKPWCISSGYEKTDVHNGLCLNALHDCAFDVGLITIDAGTLEVKLSSGIENTMSSEVYEEYFSKYDGMEIVIPHSEYRPSSDYLEYHNRNVFGKKTNRITIEYEITVK